MTLFLGMDYVILWTGLPRGPSACGWHLVALAVLAYPGADAAGPGPPADEPLGTAARAAPPG
jgi:hypothetical protein